MSSLQSLSIFFFNKVLPGNWFIVVVWCRLFYSTSARSLLFQLHLLLVGSKSWKLWWSLYKNGNQIVSWYVTNSNHASSGSNSAVLHLQVGDNVNVRLWNNRRISDNTNKYSSFSGFLLFPVWSVWKHCDFQTDHTSIIVERLQSVMWLSGAVITVRKI